MLKTVICILFFFMVIQVVNSQLFTPPAASQRVDEQNDTINRYNEHGERNGFWRVLFRNENPRYEGTFVDGKPTGKFIYYFPEGGIRAELIHKEDDDELEYEKLVQATFYHRGRKDKNIMAEGQFVDRKKQGLWRFFNERGTLVMKNYYHEDKNHGVRKTFFDCGALMETVTFHNDIKEGSWKQYYENGNLRLSAYYNNDMLNGEYEVFYDNGRRRIKGYYQDNLPDKTWTYLARSGKIERRVVYDKGEMVEEKVYIEREDHDKEPIRPGNEPEDIFKDFY